MAFSSHALAPSDTSLETKSTARPSFFARFFSALMASRQRQAEREIAAYLERSGGKLTDTAEREIERLFLSGHGGGR